MFLLEWETKILIRFDILVWIICLGVLFCFILLHTMLGLAKDFFFSFFCLYEQEYPDSGDSFPQLSQKLKPSEIMNQDTICSRWIVFILSRLLFFSIGEIINNRDLHKII